MIQEQSRSTILKTVRGYELRERIGAGGFGAVYRAYQPVVEREVAIKVILPQYANNPDFVHNFEAEAYLVAHLEHPFIVPLFDYWREPDGAYLVMRFYQAGSLRHSLEQSGPLPVNRVAEVLTQIAGALDTAHRHHVIHRDVKPENILLDHEGNAYVADFGIAKRVDQSNGKKDEKENFSGTLAYAAPELLKQQPTTPQSDIYSLGYLVYEMLTGKHPFADQSPVLMLMSHMEHELHRIDTLPAASMLALWKATAKAPEDRYASARALAVDFQRGLSDSLSDQASQELTTITLVSELVTNPYKGLRPFNEADAGEFFGRTALVQEILERLDAKNRWHNFLAVVGPSGSGKSSVVHAGLVPALRAGKIANSKEWFILTMTPGTSPLQQLRTVLLSIAIDPADTLSTKLHHSPSGLIEALQDVLQIRQDLFLVIDQFEEIFTLVEDEQERQQFLTLLFTAANIVDSHLHVVITLRADFYDKPLLYQDFGTLIQARTQVVLPLNPDELEQAITGPATQAGLIVNADLVSAIIEDVREEPGALPLLQYALTEIFEQRDGNHLSLVGYQKSGRLLGALAGRAEDVYASLNAEQQTVAQQIFLRLVALGEGTEDTRRRARYSELTALKIPRDRLQSVLDAFGKYRLLTFDRDNETREPTIEIAHEALIRGWNRLHSWLDQNRSDIRLQRLLAVAAADWRAAKQDKSYLLRGARLAQFVEWSKSSKLGLSHDEQAFLEASVTEHEQLSAREAERQAHELKLERRSRQRLQVILAILVIASIAGVGLTFLLYQERNNALRDKDIANSEALSAQSQQAFGQGDTVKALTLGVQAASIANPPNDVMDALINVAYAPGLRRIATAGHRVIAALAISPDGRYVLSGSGESPDLGPVGGPPGSASGGPPKPPDGSTNQSTRPPPPGGLPPPPAGASLPGSGSQSSPTGGISAQDTLILWDIASGQQIRTLQTDSPAIQDIVFLPIAGDNVQAIVATADNAVTLWDVTDAKVITRFRVPPAGKISLSLSQNGQILLIVGGTNPNVAGLPSQPFQIVWNVQSQQILRQVDSLESGLWTGHLSPDGKTAVSSYISGLQVVWDVATGAPISRYDYSQNVQNVKVPFYHVDIGSDNTTAVLNVGQPQVSLWNTGTGSVLKQFLAPSVTTLDAQLSGDSTELLITAQDGKLRLWDVPDGTLIQNLSFLNARFDSTAFSADGRYAVTGGADGSVYFWDLTATPIRELQHFGQGETKQAAFLPGGNQILSFGVSLSQSNYASQLILWDVKTGKAISGSTFGAGHIYMPQSMAVSLDGKYVLTGTVADVPGVPRQQGVDDSLILWDIQSEKEIRRFETSGDIFSLAFAPDSGLNGQPYVASIPQGNDIILRNVETGQSVRTFPGHTGAISALAFSPDGKWLASTGRDGKLLIWNAATGALIQTVAAAGPFVTFSPDSQRVATTITTTDDIGLWDIASGRLVTTLSGHENEINSFGFSPDGTLALSGSTDNTFILWNMTTGTIIHRDATHSTSVWQVAFSPDQKSFLSVSNGMILWRADPITLNEIRAWISQNRYLSS